MRIPIQKAAEREALAYTILRDEPDTTLVAVGRRVAAEITLPDPTNGRRRIRRTLASTKLTQLKRLVTRKRDLPAKENAAGEKFGGVKFFAGAPVQTAV